MTKMYPDHRIGQDGVYDLCLWSFGYIKTIEFTRDLDITK